MSENELVVTQPKLSPSLIRPIASVEEILAAQNDRVQLITRVLTPNVDHGIIPGTKKPTLFKAGAERLCNSFGAHPEYDVVESEKDHDRKNTYQYYDKEKTSYGMYRYVVKCNIVSFDGRIIASSIGSCSSYESKYISRPRDSENTILKMAQKRAFVSATLNAFGLSDRFTVDLEDQVETVIPVVKTEKQKEAATSVINKPKFTKDRKDHIDWLIKILNRLEVPAELHDDICIDMEGKSLDDFDFIIQRYRT